MTKKREQLLQLNFFHLGPSTTSVVLLFG